MALLDGAGVSAGSGALSPASGFYLAGGAGQVLGDASSVGFGGLLHLSTATAVGVSVASWAQFLDGSGVAVGSASGVGLGLRHVVAKGYLFGTSKMAWSVPLPMYGLSYMAAHAEVLRLPRPVLSPPCPLPTFRWLQTLTRCDLVLDVRDAFGNPSSPAVVCYTLYQQLPGCLAFKQVGPRIRTPVPWGVGSYYAAFLAGEGGQPGIWKIKWQYRRTTSSPIEEKDFCFQVSDSVLAGSPHESAPRATKFGWD